MHHALSLTPLDVPHSPAPSVLSTAWWRHLLSPFGKTHPRWGFQGDVTTRSRSGSPVHHSFLIAKGRHCTTDEVHLGEQPSRAGKRANPGVRFLPAASRVRHRTRCAVPGSWRAGGPISALPQEGAMKRHQNFPLGDENNNKRLPSATVFHTNNTLSLLQEEISSLLDKLTKCRWNNTNRLSGFYSRYFLVPKRGGGGFRQ